MSITTVYFDFETGGVEMHHPNISLAAICKDEMDRCVQFASDLEVAIEALRKTL